MMWSLSLLVGALVLAGACAMPQQTKTVKGGHAGAGFQQNTFNSSNFIGRFYENVPQTGGPGPGQSLTQLNQTGYSEGGFYSNGSRIRAPMDFEVGVCYIEVPTVQLVNDPSHIPAGNGSRPDLSRIRTCCKGYLRSIHNFKVCDPVCVNDCINGLCTAPDTCTCFPDHVTNSAGYCVATCPIGCQNGHCAGGECLCDEGHKLDTNGQFCVPVCQGNCGSIGNCTSPNTCDCKAGYKSTADGSCQPACEACGHGDCVAPNDCRCHEGYVKSEHGECTPSCPKGCGTSGQCVAPGVCSCPLGLERDASTSECVARCSQPCINGVCSPGNTCICNPGYVMDKTDPTGSRCVPHCPGGCPNGVCTMPNYCICSVGYVKDRSVKGRPSCVRRVRRSIDEVKLPQTQWKPAAVPVALAFDISDY